MIERVIRASVENRVLVLFGALLLAIAGIVAVLKTPVDALPDLSDVQVIIKTDYSGQAPEIVENEVTYPISTTMLSVPGASTVRGFSLFGTSFVYVLFEDGTDLYWARSRVLESLNSAAGKLPSGVTPELGPDATGVGWIYQYALVDKSGKNDLESLRALQDWFLKYELKTIPGVAEVASVGGEFLPQIAEGDILYMPSTLPGVSSSEAAAMLQKTDKLIRTVPEVATVFGKAGRADTATDSAPLEMIETTIQLKPESEWRPGMTMEKIIDELDKTVRLPGLANLWVMPIRNRIDMLSTGVKSPIGIKVSGQSLADIDGAAEQIEEAAKTVPGVVSAIAERLTGGRYVEVSVDRLKAARWGLTVAGVQSYVKSAVGGEMAGDVVDGIARYPITIRFPQSWRDSPEALRNLPIISGSGQSLTLGDVAEIRTSLGPSMLRTENARPAAWVFVDARDRDMASVVRDLREAIAKSVSLKPGVSVAFSGQYELMERAKDRLTLMVPMTILIIFVLLYLAFRRFAESLLILGSLPFALTGGIWLLYLLGDRLSVAVGTGFIALAGLAAEFGVVMIVYLRHAVQNDKSLADPKTFTVEALDRAIEHGAALRVRPKTMTVAVVLAGLIPILVGTGAGSEVMSRIAAPMVGGMVTAPLLSLFVIPAAWKLIMLRRRKL